MTDSSIVTVALDGLGGDHSPNVVVAGVVDALSAHPNVKCVITGDAAALKALLPQNFAHASRLEFVQAPEQIPMGAHPVEALRSFPKNSCVAAVELVKSGAATAVISAGNTGAFLAAASMKLKHLPGVRRGGIASPMPTLAGEATLMDAGANVTAKAQDIVNYAVMASRYQELVLGVANPPVGLVSVGEERDKGNEVTVEAHALLKEAPINFVGNIEGNKINSGMARVIVCDGFTGNIILKTVEGAGEALVKMILQDAAAAGETFDKADPSTWPAACRSILKRTDYSNYGGALLLGVNGTVIKCHGRSNAKAITNAVSVAIRFATARVNDAIVDAIGKLSPA
jgi:glycerol-3-phosphate acyltransferase PlsX